MRAAAPSATKLEHPFNSHRLPFGRALFTASLIRLLASATTSCLRVHRRAALSLQRFGLATSYATRLLAVPVPDEATVAASAVKEAKGLLRDIQRRVVEVRRSNKRLAKELSEWLESAMQAVIPAAPPEGHG